MGWERRGEQLGEKRVETGREGSTMGREGGWELAVQGKGTEIKNSIFLKGKYQAILEFPEVGVPSF